MSLVFSFEGAVAGRFTEIDAYPTTPGRYHYEPSRGIGHYRYQEECASNGSARCTFGDASGAVFTARSGKEYGVIFIERLEAS